MDAQLKSIYVPYLSSSEHMIICKAFLTQVCKLAEPREAHFTEEKKQASLQALIKSPNSS